jgi:hypothetical protein
LSATADIGAPTGSFGPWATGISDGERLARLRSIRALAFLLCGEAHPLVIALRDAETDPAAAALALAELDALPPLRRRRVLATYAALSAPSRRSSRAEGSRHG